MVLSKISLWLAGPHGGSPCRAPFAGPEQPWQWHGAVKGFVQRQPQLPGWTTGGSYVKGLKCTVKHGDLQLHHLKKRTPELKVQLVPFSSVYPQKLCLIRAHVVCGFTHRAYKVIATEEKP